MVNYASNAIDKNTVKAYGSDLDISLKSAINICNKIRNMDVQKALAFLSRVQDKQEAVPFTRFTDGVGHKPGIAAGRYPLKAAKKIQAVIASAVANAANQGFAEELKLVHICAHKASTPMHQGRQRRRMMKRTHIEVVLKESESQKKIAKQKPTTSPQQQAQKKINQETKQTTTTKESTSQQTTSPKKNVAEEVVKQNPTIKEKSVEEAPSQ